MPRVFPRRLPFTVVLTLVTTLWFSLAAEESQAPSAHDAAKAKLATLQYLVGGWKGVGQPQRGSTKDNWTEQAGSIKKGSGAYVGRQQSLFRHYMLLTPISRLIV